MLCFDSESVSDVRAPTVATVAEIPTGIARKDDLLLELAESLSFPDYFGQNWDALDECLRDLSWLPAGAVSIVHRDLPLASDSAGRATYLEILSGAEMAWPAQGRELVLVFPGQVADYVRTFW